MSDLQSAKFMVGKMLIKYLEGNVATLQLIQELYML